MFLGGALYRFRYSYILNQRPFYMMNASYSLKRALILPADRAAHYGEKDVWGIFTPLAVQHKAINLGQGFPNIPAPDFVKVFIHMSSMGYNWHPGGRVAGHRQ